MPRRGIGSAFWVDRPLLLGLALFGVTVVAYLRVAGNGFLLYDDPVYVTNNPYVKAGLTIKGLAWAFTTGHGGNWHPLTWISHMLDCQIFGLNPGPHHMVSVLVHAANALLLLLVLARASGAPWPSAFAASLFALHPLHVESVAWVAERKDVLSTFFWVLTMGGYVWYAERPAFRRLVPCLAAFALGLMAKPMLVTLPFVLLLLDVWPLGRLRMGGQHETRDRGSLGPPVGDRHPGEGSLARVTDGKGEDGGARRADRADLHMAGRSIGRGEQESRTARRESLPRLLLEKIPFFALSLMSILVTLRVQQSAGAVVATSHLPAGVRLANALVVYVVYIVKMIWPGDLIVLYPHPGSRPAWQIVGAVAVLLTLTATMAVIMVRAADRRAYLAVGWFWYLGTLVPVIGIVQVGIQAMADRYTYVPLIGLFIMVAWGGADLVLAWHIPRTVTAALAALTIAACALGTWNQTGYWKSDLVIFEHAATGSEGNVMALFNLASALDKAGREDEAILRYRQALSILPDDAEIRRGLASALAKRGSLDEAAAQYREALRIEPSDAESAFGLGNALMSQGRIDEAIGRYEEALRAAPGLAQAHNNLGTALARIGRTREAIAHLETALRFDPDHAGAHMNLGALLLAEGRRGEAATHFAEALRIHPDDQRARESLARARQASAAGAAGAR